jgi:predicted NAD/FAD-binding protein
MQFSKKEKEELIESVSYDLNRISGLAENPENFLSLNKNGTIRKNSSVTPQMIADARERKVFLEGLLTKLNEL